MSPVLARGLWRFREVTLGLVFLECHGDTLPPLMYLTSVLVYLGALIVVGLWQSRRVKTGEDFVVAGRTLPARVLVFTLLSTWVGSGSLFGGAGNAYRTGFASLWQSAGAWVGIALVFFLAHRIRRIKKFTMPDILELRYGGAARILGTFVTAIAYTTIAAYQFRGGGRLLNLIAPIDIATGALITAAFCIAYTALAGMLSVAYLDVGNGLMMIIGVGAAVVFTDHSGRWSRRCARRAASRSSRPVRHTRPMARRRRAVPADDAAVDGRSEHVPEVLLGARRTGRAHRGHRLDPRHDPGRDVSSPRLARLAASSIPGLSATDSEAIVMRVAVDGLPVVLGIGLIRGAVAIIISTANSFLLTPATGLVNDVYPPLRESQGVRPPGAAFDATDGGRAGRRRFHRAAFFPTIFSMALWVYKMTNGVAIPTPALLAAFSCAGPREPAGRIDCRRDARDPWMGDSGQSSRRKLSVRDAHGVSRVRRLGPRSGVRQPGDAGTQRTGPGCHYLSAFAAGGKLRKCERF